MCVGIEEGSVYRYSYVLGGELLVTLSCSADFLLDTLYRPLISAVT